MTQNLPRTATPFQARPKAPAKLDSVFPDTAAQKANIQAMQPSSTRTMNRTVEKHKTPVDTSDKATAAFVRRVLCNDKDKAATKSMHELLPPLTSSNEADLQLYAILAIIMKEFVHSWYAKITPDQAFIDEVIQVIAHCTRALEQRLRTVDLEAILLDEIPGLLESHIEVYRISHSNSLPLDSESRQVYHSLRPHPALYPIPLAAVPSTIVQQQENEASYHQLLAQATLAVLLPTEDLENGCLRGLVSSILGDMVVGQGIAGKACEGWLLWEVLTKFLEDIAPFSHSPHTTSVKASGSAEYGPNVGRFGQLERFGLLSTENKKPTKMSESALEDKQPLSIFFWNIVQYIFLAFTALRFVVGAFIIPLSFPARSSPVTLQRRSNDADDKQCSETMGATGSVKPTSLSKEPILSMRIWSCVSHLLQLDMRMPWLSGFISLLQWAALVGPGCVGDTNGRLDKLLSHYFRQRILDPVPLPSILHSVRTSLFPHNALAPARATPSLAEQAAIKSRCADAILNLVPPVVLKIYLRTDDNDDDRCYDQKGAQQGRSEEAAEDTFHVKHGRENVHARTRLRMRHEIEEGVLALFDDPYCNKHFIYSILELILLRLMPELGETGVQGLMEARLG